MRPTITLAMIVKNEENNLPRLLKSVEGCFDEIHITDTGSTDKTVEIAKSFGAKVFHFDWIDDFSAARNYSFSHAETDFIMWLDADDVLVNPEAFKAFRDNAMDDADYWLANYFYGKTKEGKGNCAFLRERIVRRKKNIKWRYFIHEGLHPATGLQPIRSELITTWWVQHERTEDDIQKDRGRNLRILKEREKDLDARMTFYYGKELHDNGDIAEGLHYLLKAAKDPKTEMQDRVLAIRFAVLSYMKLNQWEKAVGIGLTGIQLSPNEAELYALVGDSYVGKQELKKALPFYYAALGCESRKHDLVFHDDSLYNGGTIKSVISIYCAHQMFEDAKIMAELGLARFGEEFIPILEKINEGMKKLRKGAERKKDGAIVITCPFKLYDWNPVIEKERGVGGSETAVIYMAKHLHDLSGKKVIVYNDTKPSQTFDGVEYRDNSELMKYFEEYEPDIHVAWRHALRFTYAPTYVWSHDLGFMQMENGKFDKVFCLSEFHKRYQVSKYGVNPEKIIVTRNGINPERFHVEQKQKKNKLVWSSSPDRGLEYALRVADQVREEIPDLEMSIYYGFDNMKKNPDLKGYIEFLEAEILKRTWVTMKGNMPQSELYKDLSDAKVWLYPTNFKETFCITALEMLSLKVFPVARKYGALQDTLKEADEKGWAKLIEGDIEKESVLNEFAKETILALKEDKFAKIEFDAKAHDWKQVAKEWLEIWQMPLTQQ